MLPSFPEFSPSLPRKVINALKSEVSSFLNRFNQRWQFIKVGDSLVPKTTANYFKRLQQRANERIKKTASRNAKLPFIPLSERGWATPGAHRTVGQQTPTPPRLYRKKLSEFTSLSSLEAYIKNLEKSLSISLDERDEKWRENVVKALKNVYGDAANPLIAHIKAMPIEDFVLVMDTQDVSIDYVYLALYLNESLDKVTAYFDVDKVKDLIKNYR